MYIVIMKLKEHKNLAIRAKIMEYLSKMNKPDFPASRDEVLESLIEFETLSNGPKIINFTDGSQWLQIGRAEKDLEQWDRMKTWEDVRI